MKAVKIKNDSVIPSGTTDGCVTLNGDKQRAARQNCNYITALDYAVYENGKRVHVTPTRSDAIRYCTEHDEPNKSFHIRMTNALVYFHEHGQKPVYFRGFHTVSWKNKTHQKALIDYDNHTSKETTERYDAIAYALEQMAQHEDETHDKP